VNTVVRGNWELQKETQELRDIENDFMLFIEEVFAELFGFHFGFNDNWELYLDKVWSYFAKEVELDAEHIARSVLTYFAFGPGKGLAADEITMQRIETCVQQISAVVKKTNDKIIREEEIDLTFPIVWAFLNVSDVVRSHFLSKPVIYDSAQANVEMAQTLEKGMLVYCDNPAEILFSLISDSAKHETKHQYATILSLCNCFHKLLGRV
jgi:hypothetical protein